MDWSALRDRLSRDRGWTPREIDGLTTCEALECLELALQRPKSIVAAPREAREIVAAARERSRAWIDDELRRIAEPEAHVNEDQPCDWERLAVMSADLTRESTDHEDDRRANGPVADSRREVDWLKRIHEELRLLRQAVAGPVVRSLWSE